MYINNNIANWDRCKMVMSTEFDELQVENIDYSPPIVKTWK